MKTLISTTEALRRAFRADDEVTSDTLTEADLIVAERRYIRPVVGAALHEKLLEGAYPSFVSDYLSDAVARLARVVALRRNAVRQTRAGVVQPKADNTVTVDAATLQTLKRSLREEALTLLRRATEHLAANVAEYPEYDEQLNLFNRCSTDGGFVQIH